MRIRYRFHWTLAQSVVLAVLGGSWLIAAVVDSAGHRPGDGPQAARHARAALRINPNTAPAASLQRLFNIGPGRAEAVVRYREAHPDRPFTRPADLARVSGIGPGTVERNRDLLICSTDETTRGAEE